MYMCLVCALLSLSRKENATEEEEEDDEEKKTNDGFLYAIHRQ